MAGRNAPAADPADEAGLLRGHHKTAAIERGPLVYALRMGEDWRQVHADQAGHELPHGDWEVYPTTPWNYALERHGKNDGPRRDL